MRLIIPLAVLMGLGFLFLDKKTGSPKTTKIPEKLPHTPGNVIKIDPVEITASAPKQYPHSVSFDVMIGGFEKLFVSEEDIKVAIIDNTPKIISGAQKVTAELSDIDGGYHAVVRFRTDSADKLPYSGSRLIAQVEQIDNRLRGRVKNMQIA